MSDTTDTNGIDAAAELIDSVSQEDEFDYTFKKPFDAGGVKYSKMHFDFDRVSMKDMQLISSELARSGIMVLVPATSFDFQIRFLAKAANVALPVIMAMKPKDGSALCLRAQSFLMQGASGL